MGQNCLIQSLSSDGTELNINQNCAGNKSRVLGADRVTEHLKLATDWVYCDQRGSSSIQISVMTFQSGSDYNYIMERVRYLYLSHCGWRRCCGWCWLLLRRVKEQKRQHGPGFRRCTVTQFLFIKLVQSSRVKVHHTWAANWDSVSRSSTCSVAGFGTDAVVFPNVSSVSLSDWDINTSFFSFSVILFACSANIYHLHITPSACPRAPFASTNRFADLQ